MDKLAEREYSMPVPKFFLSVVEFDRENKTDFSARLVTGFKIMDLTYALIDGKLEKSEADTIDVLQHELMETCRSQGITYFWNEIDPHKYVSKQVDEKLVVTTGECEEVSIMEKPEIKATTINNEHKRTRAAKSGTALDELDKLIGLSKAKKELHELADFVKVQQARIEQGLPAAKMSYHLVFTGNPGTGKTTVARLVAEIYKDLGVVSKGQLIEVSAKDLVAGYVGQTSIKTGEVIEKAIGGVLFIDEAYSLLDRNGQGYGHEAIDTLLKEMEDKRGDFAVIIAGYDEQIKDFVGSNPGLKSRFNRFIHFEDYSADEMYSIFKMLCKKGHYEMSPEAAGLIKETLADTKADLGVDFANGRTVRNLYEKIITKQASRVASLKEKTVDVLSTILEDDVKGCIGEEKEKEEKLEDILTEFNSLIGLDTVKEEISELVYIVQNQLRRKEKGLKVPALSLHLVFMGNPGTGKTTVARYVAKIYKSLGLVSKGQLVETDRSGLVAGYVGQTAIKTREVIDSAIGGVLFIDEAYTLANGTANDFGQEAIDTLLKAMEDLRDDLVVIVAGYNELMENFIHSNPGLESRFNRYIHFDDYSSDQIISIIQRLCENNQYKLSEEAEKALKEYFDEIDISSIGNGRGARNIFEKLVTQQAKRIEKNSNVDSMDLQLITFDDVNKVLMKG